MLDMNLRVIFMHAERLGARFTSVWSFLSIRLGGKKTGADCRPTPESLMNLY
jgi:hypothetical protein